MRPAPSTRPSASLSSSSASGQLVAHRADLEDHHADRVRDDVVELARDARSLLGDGNPRRRLALPLGVHRPHLRRLSVSFGDGRAHLRGLDLL